MTITLAGHQPIQCPECQEDRGDLISVTTNTRGPREAYCAVCSKTWFLPPHVNADIQNKA